VGHATACAAGAAVLKVFDEEDLVARSAEMGEKLLARLKERFADHPHIGDIRGRAMFRGLELVADRETKEPFPADWQLAARIKSKAMEHGLICYPMGGTADRFSGDHVLLAPPFIMEEKHLDELVDKLGRAIDESLADARRDAARRKGAGSATG
jgi:adenosylmethionine-8-amino-7-oxononanoate aminotransferase